MKAATATLVFCRSDRQISIHAAREGGDPLAFKLRVRLKISIHAAREGGDASTCRIVTDEIGISIHAAREGGDYYPPLRIKKARYFNPRRP